jgi:hypothetical protein
MNRSDRRAAARIFVERMALLFELLGFIVIGVVLVRSG